MTAWLQGDKKSRKIWTGGNKCLLSLQPSSGKNEKEWLRKRCWDQDITESDGESSLGLRSIWLNFIVTAHDITLNLRHWKNCCKFRQLLLTFVNRSCGSELKAPQPQNIDDALHGWTFLKVQLLNSELGIDYHGCLWFDQSIFLGHACSSREIKPLSHIIDLLRTPVLQGSWTCLRMSWFIFRFNHWLVLNLTCDNKPVASCHFRFFTCCLWREDEHAIKYHLQDESNIKPLICIKNT